MEFVNLGLSRPQDRALYRQWLSLIEGRTNRDVADAMPGFSEPGVAKLRRAEPSRFANRTRELLRAFVEGHQRGRSAYTRAELPLRAAHERPVAQSVTGSASSGPDRVRVWIQEFLLKLTKAGATDEEVDEARILLSQSDLVTYASRVTQEPLTEGERLQLVKSIATVAIIPTLKKLGRKVDASFAR